MVRNRLPHVAVLVDTATGWGRSIIRGIIRYSVKHGPWHLTLEPRGQDEYLHLAKGWSGHGVIARISSQRMLRALQESKLPVVNVSGIDLSNNKFPQVTTDYREAARMALQHFRDRGFRWFAYSGMPRSSMGRRHRDAFRELVEAAGFHCHVYEPKRSATQSENAMRRLQDKMRWLKALPKPVGIFTWSTGPARELLEACRLAEISVPYEAAVLGGNVDDLLSDVCWPPLSGLRVPTEQIGHDAAVILDRMMRRGKAPAKPILLAPTGVEEKRSTDTLAIEDPDVADVLTFIRTHACKTIHLSDILRVVPLSRRSIERKFQQCLGHSPVEEIRRVRMAKAKTLLAETSMSMPAIAEACGYDTYNYLSRVFTSENGMTPREFRKRLQGR